MRRLVLQSRVGDTAVELVRAVAAAHGLWAQVEYLPEYPVTETDAVGTGFLADTVRQVFGEERFRPIGREAIRSNRLLRPPGLGRWTTWQQGMMGSSGKEGMITHMTDPREVVEQQLAAYNSHDIDAFAATYAEDVLVHRRDGSRLQGRQALRDTYAGLFAEGRCRAEILGRLSEGDWVVDHELAHGLADDPLRVLVAYRVREGLIDRVDFLG